MAKILIIEDEIKIALLIKRGLELERYTVELSCDGKEGLAKARMNNYDLIVLDVMLPEINGIELSKTLRQKKIETPIIMLTARDTAEDKIAGLAAGADDYMIKPFVFRELIAKIKSLLERDKVKIAVTRSANEIMAGNKIPNIQEAAKNLADEITTDDDKLRLSEFSKRILDNAPISIITIDKKGFITSANRYYENFSKTKNYRNHNIFTSEFFIRENLLDNYRKLLSDGTPVRKENCYEKNNKGEDKYLKIIAVPLRDADGNIDGALSMAVDNTETVLFKNKLQELNKDLEKKIEQRTAELNAANRELARVLNVKVTFMANVSHELRTSLAIIQGNLELMDMGSAVNTDDKESHDQVFDEIKRMSGLLADLTLLANSDSSIQRLNFEKFDLDSLLSSVSKSLEVVAQGKNIKIEHENGKTPIEIMADKSKLERLIINLIRNAIRYNKKDGWVKVWAENTENEIILNVEDSGIGISEEHLPHIFERFYRANKARSGSDGGSGLGLAICKWVAESHGGKIDVKSLVGQGSLFTVRLPRNRKNQQQAKS